jgi:hypothetical protein
MNPVILIELARKWEAMAKTPNHINGVESAQLSNARDEGSRAARSECATQLRQVVLLLGDNTSQR